MAQGLDDVEEARTSRTLDSVLETVGMDCNPGYGGHERFRDFAHHTHRSSRPLFFCADSRACRAKRVFSVDTTRAPTTERVATRHDAFHDYGTLN